MIKIAVLGHGVVGSGVLEVFTKNHKSIIAKAGENMEIKYILDLRKFPDLPYSDKFVQTFDPIINDPEINLVVEVMGGVNPAYDYVKRCLLAGKNVVTSNKELVATYGSELLEIAHEKNINFLFEASVGGGIPIIRPISQCLAANELNEVAGILNGTTNFILTRMISDSMSFDDALALAQKLGYAEHNPAADVEGLDACRKICILASLAYGRHVNPKDVHTEGISKITLEDVKYAAAWGGVIKLIGRAKKLPDGRLSAMVCPAFIKKSSQLAGIDDVFNGIMVRGDAIGDVVFYGRGAGKLPTASAVVADIIDVAKHLKARKYLYWLPPKDGYVCNYLEAPSVFFVRVRTQDRLTAIKAANSLFGKVSEMVHPDMPAGEAAFITPELPEGELNRAIASLSSLDYENIACIRVLDY
ncbi:MAG TPA: homoserine dehydrogenase [Clostridia bacterium]|nr:homoserine dehydrogenase [Clostridia bacterium]